MVKWCLDNAELLANPLDQPHSGSTRSNEVNVFNFEIQNGRVRQNLSSSSQFYHRPVNFLRSLGSSETERAYFRPYLARRTWTRPVFLSIIQRIERAFNPVSDKLPGLGSGVRRYVNAHHLFERKWTLKSAKCCSGRIPYWILCRMDSFQSTTPLGPDGGLKTIDIWDGSVCTETLYIHNISVRMHSIFVYSLNLHDVMGYFSLILWKVGGSSCYIMGTALLYGTSEMMWLFTSTWVSAGP